MGRSALTELALLFAWAWRRSCCGRIGVRRSFLLLEFFLQLLDHRRELTSAPLFDFLAKLLFDAPPLLDVTAFKLGAPLSLQFQTGLPKRGVGIPLEPFATLSLTVAELPSLLRCHLHPPLGV